MRARNLAVPSLLFASALLLRWLYLRQIALSPFFDFLQLDPLYYYDWAKTIASGDWLGKEIFEQSPLYPYLLAVYMVVVGQDLYVLRLIQIGVGAATCVLVYLLGARLFDGRTGAIAGIGCALYAPFYFYEGQVMKEFLTPPLATGAILLVVWSRPPTARALFGAGVLLGLACLVRDNFLLLLAVLGGWAAFEAWKRAGLSELLRAALAMAAGALLVLLPVALRNYAVGGALVLTTSGGGEGFYIGNGPYANGAYVPPPWVRSNPRFEHEDFRKKARELTGSNLDRAQASRYWWREGVKALAANPRRAVWLWARKFALFWNDHELPDNYSFYSFRKFSWLLAHLLTFGPVAALAWAGLLLSAHEWRKLVPLYLAGAGYMLSVLIVFNFGRFRLPIVPILLVFAGKAIATVVEAFRSRPAGASAGVGRRRAVLAAVTLAVAVPFMYVDLSSGAEEPFQDRLHLAAAWKQAGHLDEAGRTLRQVIADAEAVVRRHGGDPTRADTTPGGITFVLALSAAHKDLAAVLMDQHEPAEAAAQYRQAAALSPSDATLLVSLGSALKQAGDREGAIAALLSAARVNPASFEAHFDLATLYYEAGRLQEAEQSIERARGSGARLTTMNLADYHYGLGAILYAQQGRETEAASHFEEALRLNPGAEQADEVREALRKIRSGRPNDP